MKRREPISLVLGIAVILVVGVLIGFAEDDPAGGSERMVCSEFVLQADLLDVSGTLSVYRAVAPDFSHEDVAQLMEWLGIEGTIVERENLYVVSEGEKVLEVYKEPGTGFIRYADEELLHSEDIAEELPSLEEAIAAAAGLLEGLGWLPEASRDPIAAYASVREYNNEGELVQEGLCGVAVGFSYEVEEIPVVGPGARVAVAFGANGELAELRRAWRELEPGKQVAVRPWEEALEQFKSRWPEECIVGDRVEIDLLTQVNIEEAFIAYYAHPGNVPQSELEPVYVFLGTFEVLEPALADAQEGGGWVIVDSGSFDIVIPALAN